MKETSNPALSANNSLNSINQSNYTQLYSVGKDVEGQIFEAKIINGFPQYRLSIPNSKPTEYQPFEETIDINGKTDTKFKAIAAMPELCFNGTTSYVVVLTEDGQVGFLYQETTYPKWRWYGLMQNKPPYLLSFNWIAVNTGDKGNAQVILINDTGTPALLWQDNLTGNWTWDWLPPNQKVNPPQFNIHLSTVQLGTGNNGNLQAVFTDQMGQPYLIWQNNNNGDWSNLSKLPADSNTRYSLVQLAYGNNNNLQCVFQDANNNLYLIWQDSNNGNWTWFGRLPIGSEVGNKPIISYMLRESGNTLSLLIVYEANSLEEYNVYRILQDANGKWSWKGFYQKTSSPYP